MGRVARVVAACYPRSHHSGRLSAGGDRLRLDTDEFGPLEKIVRPVGCK